MARYLHGPFYLLILYNLIDFYILVLYSLAPFFILLLCGCLSVKCIISAFKLHYLPLFWRFQCLKVSLKIFRKFLRPCVCVTYVLHLCDICNTFKRLPVGGFFFIGFLYFPLVLACWWPYLRL